MNPIRNHLRLRWFLSYMAIFVIAIIFSIGIYLYSYYSIEKEVEKANNALLVQIHTQIDGRLEELHRTYSQLSLHTGLKNLSRIKPPFQNEHYYSIYEAVEYLRSISLVNSFFLNVNVFFQNTNTVLSSEGHMDSVLFYDLYIQRADQIDFSYEDFIQKMNGKHSYAIDAIYEGERCKYLVAYGDMLPPDAATVFFLISSDHITQMLNNMKWSEESIVLLLDAESQILCSTSDSFAGSLELPPNGSDFMADGTKYKITSRPTNITPWRYVILTPEAVFNESARSIQFFTLGGLLLCGIVCIYMSFFLAKQNYNPIQDIITVFHSQSNARYDVHKNEYIWIKEAINGFFTEHERAKLALHRNRLIIKSAVLNRLLSGTYGTTAEEENTTGLNLESGQFLVVLIRVNPVSVKEDNPYESLNFSKFAIINVFEELVGSHFTMASSEMESYAAIIIELPENAGKELCLDSIEEFLYLAQQEILTHFGIEVSIAIGGLYGGYQGIRNSFMEAEEAISYSGDLGNSGIIYYRDIMNSQSNYYYPMEVEQKLLNALRAGNEESAAAVVSDIVKRNFGEVPLPPMLKKCLLSDITSTFIKVLEEDGDMNILYELGLPENFYSQMTTGALQTEIQNAVNCICLHNRRKLELQQKSDRLSEEIKSYIAEHYQDNSLNVSMIGLHFNLTPAYLSKLFKQQTGESLLNYINSVRVESAKELLQEGKSVADVSAATGFTNIGSMIRIFKKHTGITPGQMRKIT